MECGNRLRVGVRAKNASVSGLRVGPSKFVTLSSLRTLPETPPRFSLQIQPNNVHCSSAGSGAQLHWQAEEEEKTSLG